MSVFVVRAFVKMRSAFAETRELAKKLALLEQELKIRLNLHEAAIVDVLQRIMRILDPPPPPPEPPHPKSASTSKKTPSPTASEEELPGHDFIGVTHHVSPFRTPHSAFCIS